MLVNLFNSLPWQYAHAVACVVSLLAWLWIVMTWNWRPILWVITLSLALGLLWTVFYLVAVMLYFRFYCHIWSAQWYAERAARFEPVQPVPPPLISGRLPAPFAGQYQRPRDPSRVYPVVRCADCGQIYTLTEFTTGCYNCGSDAYFNLE